MDEPAPRLAPEIERTTLAARVAALTEELADRTNELEHSEALRSPLDAKIAVLADKLERSEASRRPLEAKTAALTDKLERSEALRRPLEANTAALTDKLERSETARKQVKAQFDAVLASSSWRITAPLRWLARNLRLKYRYSGKNLTD